MNEKRRFEFIADSSSKFWEIWRDGAAVHTRYGRIGSDGQTTVKSETDEQKAQKLCDKLVKEKTDKGYTAVAESASLSSSPSPAASSSSGASSSGASPAKGLRGFSSWMSTGLAYRSADFDANDMYLFNCSINGDGNLAVHFDGTAGASKFVCAAAAVQSGSEKIHLSQGGATLSQNHGHVDEETPTPAFPPFLISRSLFAALKAGQTIAWPTVLTGDGKTVAVTKTGAGTRKIPVDGKKQTVKTIEAAGDDVTLIVLDDADWPLILVDDEADDCGWWLRAVGKDLDADAIPDGGDDEDGEGEEDDEGGRWRRFEMDEKFWAISLDGASHTVRFGKIGTDGQLKSKSFDDEESARKDYDKLIREKTGKGYEEVDGDD